MSTFRFSAAVVLAALVVSSWAMPSASAAEPRHAAMVIDANTGKILHEASADEPRHPASLTKMMTLYMVFEEMRRGRLTANSQIPMTERGAAAAPSKLGLEVGETIAVIDAIKALITKSANDVAIALAEHIAGSEAQFARLMTERARQLGMTGTTFRNASGLPDPGQITTARDMLILALRLNDDFPDQFRLFSLRSFTYRGKTYRTHNTLMHNFDGMDGIKTGYTRDSGFNVVTSVRTKGLHLVGAVFGGATAASRNSQMRFLLRRAMVDASTEKTRTARPMLVAEPSPAAKPSKPAGKTVALATPPASPAWKTSVAAAKPALAAAPPQPAKPRAETRPVAQPQVEEKAVEAPRAPPRETPVQIVSVKPVPMGASSRKDNSGDGAIADVAETKAAAAEPSPPVEDAPARTLDFADLKEAAGKIAAPAQKPAPSALAARSLSPVAAPARAKTVAAKSESQPATGRSPSTLNNQLAVLTQGPAPAVRPRPVAVATTPSLGRPPSTLNAQASGLAFAQPVKAEPWHVGAPLPAGSASAEGGYEIEIGVFATAEEADQRLARAQGLSPALSGSTGLALPANGTKPLAYRARFTGLGQAGANAACNDLRRQSQPCRVTAAE